MNFFDDIRMMLKKKKLILIESYQEAEGVYTFIFKKPEDLNWKAGQHGFFTIIHKKIEESMRPFSISSAPSEGMVKISVGIHNQPSEFKKALLELKNGMEISMRGPVGPMYIAQSHPTLLIAGGIGITPFRAILKDLEICDYNSEIVLNYLDSKGSFVYRSEIERIAKNKGFKINYLQNRDELYDHIEVFTSKHNNTGRYYLAGSKSMVTDLSKYLRNKNIDKKNIKKDPFLGYK